MAFTTHWLGHGKRRCSENLSALACSSYIGGWNMHPLFEEDDDHLCLGCSWDCCSASSWLGLLQPRFLSLALPCHCWGKGQFFYSCPRIWFFKVPPLYSFTNTCNIISYIYIFAPRYDFDLSLNSKGIQFIYLFQFWKDLLYHVGCIIIFGHKIS